MYFLVLFLQFDMVPFIFYVKLFELPCYNTNKRGVLYSFERNNKGRDKETKEAGRKLAQNIKLGCVMRLKGNLFIH